MKRPTREEREELRRRVESRHENNFVGFVSDEAVIKLLDAIDALEKRLEAAERSRNHWQRADRETWDYLMKVTNTEPAGPDSAGEVTTFGLAQSLFRRAEAAEQDTARLKRIEELWRKGWRFIYKNEDWSLYDGSISDEHTDLVARAQTFAGMIDAARKDSA